MRIVIAEDSAIVRAGLVEVGSPWCQGMGFDGTLLIFDRGYTGICDYSRNERVRGGEYVCCRWGDVNDKL